MCISDLDTHSVEQILHLVPDRDVVTFAEGFSEHKDAVNAVWNCRPKVSVDDVMLRDLATLVRVIKRRKNLKIVGLIRARPKIFRKIFAAIAANCSKLEILDIPGLELLIKDVNLLCSCVTLKYLNIGYGPEIVTVVTRLVANNPGLEGVCLEGHVTHDLIQCLPESITNIELLTDNTSDLTNFWNRVQSWKLQKLTLRVRLERWHILKLSTQTQLKHLDILFNEGGDTLQVLFSNNPNLESVTLRSFSRTRVACLQHLPPTLKSLTLKGFWTLNINAFVEYVKTWRLQNLSLPSYPTSNWMRVMQVAPSLFNLHVNMSRFRDETLIDFELLKQLKFLILFNYSTTNNNLLRRILQSVVNLEKLALSITSSDRKLFEIIAWLPNLKDFFLHLSLYGVVKCYEWFHTLSRSQSLRVVRVWNCRLIKNADILALIRGCSSLSKLTLIDSGSFLTSRGFLRNIGRILEQQAGRKEVFNLEIDNHIYPELLLNLHPLLNVEIHSKYSKKFLQNPPPLEEVF